MIKLIATDVDGTFLDAKGEFDRERFAILLDQLDSKGIPFVIASGNGMERLLTLFQGFEERLFFVADNGSHVYHSGKTLIRRGLTSEEIGHILDYFTGNWTDVCLMLSTDREIFMQNGAGHPFEGTDLPITGEQMKAFLSRVHYLEDLAAYPATASVQRASLWLPEDEVEALTLAFNRFFRGKLVAVTSGYGSVDILPEGIHKAWGLEHLLHELEILPEQVMAFGDSDNDIELLRYVGYSYAMENSTDRLKSVARYQAPSHHDNGVMRTIEKLLL